MSAVEGSERALRRKAADRLGWKIIGNTTAEVRCERTFAFGPRTVVIRGRVPVALPGEMTAVAGDAAVAEIVDPTVEQFRIAMERAAPKILTEPDDVSQTHIYERSSFFSALEDARRGLVQAYQQLENERVDRKVDAALGLRFYLEGFTTELREFEYFVGPTNSGKTHAAIEILRAAGAACTSPRCACSRSKCTNASTTWARRRRSSPAKSASSTRRRATSARRSRWSTSSAGSTSPSSTKRRCSRTPSAAGPGRWRSPACARNASSCAARPKACTRRAGWPTAWACR